MGRRPPALLFTPALAMTRGHFFPICCKRSRIRSWFPRPCVQGRARCPSGGRRRACRVNHSHSTGAREPGTLCGVESAGRRPRAPLHHGLGESGASVIPVRVMLQRVPARPLERVRTPMRRSRQTSKPVDPPSIPSGRSARRTPYRDLRHAANFSRSSLSWDRPQCARRRITA